MSHLLKSLLVVGLLVGGSGIASAAVLPADATTNRVVWLVRNVTGSTQSSGTAYIFQDSTNDANVLVAGTFGQESSLGLDVTTTTSADSNAFAGCQLDDTCLDDQLCRMVRQGPALCRWAGSTDNTNTRMATVGTTTVAGNLGSGTLAGLVMSGTLTGVSDTEVLGTGNNELRWIMVNPDNN